MKKQTVELLPIDSVTPYPRNARVHSEANIAKIVASIKEFGWTVPILVDEDTTVLAGHGRLLAARALLMPQVPCLRLPGLSSAQKRAYRLADNRLTLDSDWDFEALKLELGEIDIDLALTGFDSLEIRDFLFDHDSSKGKLQERFGLCPATVFDSRTAWWKERKAAWDSYGFQSALGRSDNLQKFSDFVKARSSGKGSSVFDPVLCELAYRWMCPKGGVIFDPFAGGCVRGIMAALLGREYVGIDLRSEQVEENRCQAKEIVTDDLPMPVWHCGNSADARKIVGDLKADFVWSCPGYVDREHYSSDSCDTSNQKDWTSFQSLYRKIVHESVAILKDDRFCGFMVGEARKPNKMGEYWGFLPETILAFEAAGARFYNDTVYITALGPWPVMITEIFSKSRKMAKIHQNVLFFVKGDAARATKNVGDVEFGDIDLMAE